MSLAETTIVGKGGTKVGVTGQNELLVRVSSTDTSGSGALATEATSQLIANSVDNLLNTQIGQHAVSFISPALPYSITNNAYCAYSIMTQGSVAIDGVTVPSGFILNVSCGSGEVLQGKIITDVSSGSVFITLQEKQ